MFDHIGLRVRDFTRSKALYSAVLQPLGYGVQSEGDGYIGYGPEGAPRLWLHPVPDGNLTGVHVAFEAATHDAVHRFHAAGLAAGCRDNGAPGPRKDYGDKYYAAFLIDPDGNNIEAVCMK
jgi:catechol 2,3-dioxygenase-like lactoylglutathione lyase family enzyme